MTCQLIGYSVASFSSIRSDLSFFSIRMKTDCGSDIFATNVFQPTLLCITAVTNYMQQCILTWLPF